MIQNGVELISDGRSRGIACITERLSRSSNVKTSQLHAGAETSRKIACRNHRVKQTEQAELKLSR